ncbi:MAG TPA: transketolase [Acidimicrobiia bacterium]
MSEISSEQLAVNTIKSLAMDAVQKANSGHPGMPMGMADIAVTLWSRFLTVDPDHPEWPDRDRFVVSNGHGSMLLYSLLHLSGFPVSLEDIENFRQWGSHTAGHPEIDQAIGIEMTTGPLGQGFGTGVGMAIAEEHLRARLGEDLVDHRTYGFVSDGDLMEGVSAEAASLAGHLALGKLIYFYDDNNISIDGSTDITFSEDVAARFAAQRWHVATIDGHDRLAIAEATEQAIAETDRPSMIICKTHIAHGAPNAQDTSEAHGSPLGNDEIEMAKEGMGYPTEPAFLVDATVYEFFAGAMERGRLAHQSWTGRLSGADDETRQLWDQLRSRDEVRIDGPGFDVGLEMATRASSGKLFPEMAEKVPGLIGGAADLVGSTKTVIDSSRLFSKTDRGARDIAFGIREHAMGTITNGIAVHGGLRPYGATFFVFSDYMRPAVRLSALMKARSIWVYTHDSVFLGEDGPTHQPIEHLASLRAMPDLWVIRPADANEVVQAWNIALNRHDGPVALILSRQGIPTLEPVSGGVGRGGYIVKDGTDVTLIATGSEVPAALGAAAVLDDSGISARVVSLPCWELFHLQGPEYQKATLGTSPRVSIEAAATFGWSQIVGSEGLSIGIDHFGASAPDNVLAEQFGFTPESIALKVQDFLGG